MTSLQNNIFYFNLFSDWLHPHPPTTHTTKLHPQIQRYSPPYTILLLFSLYFCGIRRYFLQILIVSAHGGPTSLYSISHKTKFHIDPHCVSSWISYRLRQAFPWQFLVSVCLYQFNIFLFNKNINMFRVGIKPPQHILFFSLNFCLIYLYFNFYYHVLLKKRLCLWDSNPEHVHDFHEQEDIKLLKTERN